MPARVERSFELSASPERVWAFLSDPERRARAISVVDDYTIDDADGRRGTWHVKLPIPLVNRTVSVRTRDVDRRPPEYVKFVGRSRVMEVTGEHEIVPTADGSRLVNTFVVDGKVPGVERYFQRNLDGELENLRRELERFLRAEP